MAKENIDNIVVVVIEINNHIFVIVVIESNSHIFIVTPSAWLWMEGNGNRNQHTCIESLIECQYAHHEIVLVRIFTFNVLILVILEDTIEIHFLGNDIYTSHAEVNYQGDTKIWTNGIVRDKQIQRCIVSMGTTLTMEYECDNSRLGLYMLG